MRLSTLRSAVQLSRAWIRERRAEKEWRRHGCPLPPPPHVKRRFLRQRALQENFGIFVETGTLFGDTLINLRPYFKVLHSIEIYPEFYEKAVVRFAKDRKITVWHGDSGDILPKVLELVREPAMFWLDGHYSGEGTGRGIEDTPIFRELKHIASHDFHGKHLIVVDDARCFCGKDGYPEKDELRNRALKMGYVSFEHVEDFFLIR